MKKNLWDDSFLGHFLKRYLLLAVLFLTIGVWGQTYYNMSSGNYLETFTNWTSPSTGTNWSSVGTSSVGTIPVATNTTVSSASFQTMSSTGGLQNGTTNLQFLSTGATSNTNSVAFDLNLNFASRNAGNLTFDVATVSNGTGDRVASLKVYYSLDGSSWTELTGTNLPYVATNNVAGSGSVSIALPSALNNQSTVKLRFYNYNGTAAGSTGSRPKISIDNVAVTSTAIGQVNGAIDTNEYGTGNSQNYVSGSQTWYMRSDATNLYIGLSGATNSQGAVIYLDKDAQVPVNGGSNATGSLVGQAYDGFNLTDLQFRSDLVVYFKNGYQEYRTANGSNGWNTAVTTGITYSDNGSGNTTREIAIPWSSIGGQPAAYNWFGYVVNGSNTSYGQVPNFNPGSSSGTSNNWNYYFTVLSASSPFTNTSYTFTGTVDANNFGPISVYDFTMNTAGKYVSRSGGTIGAWNVANNLVLNAGNIYLGSGANATNIGGNLNILGGNLDMGAVTSPMTVSKNVSVSSGATFNLSSGFSGDLFVGGNFTNNAGTGFNGSFRMVQLYGNAAQTIAGDTTFSFLTFNNSFATAPQITLSNNITVNNTLDFTKGIVSLGSNNITVASSGSIINGSSTSYAVANSTGKIIKQSVGNTAVTFPVGLSSSNYTPVTVTNTSGTSNVGVSVKNPVTNALLDATKALTLEWNISSSAATTATIAPIWQASNQGASFTNTGAGELGNYTTSYSTYPVTLNTTNTSATGVALQNGTNYIVVGNTNAVVCTVPVNVTAAAATNGNAQSSVSWTNASCYDEVMIVAAPAANTGVPSGNGSTYTANSVFGTGTALGNGFVVYKGSASPQVITALTNGTTYYFKIFTRKGTVWSNGVETTATPVWATSATDYFRSNVASGTWASAGSWQSSTDNSTWITATAVPTSAATTITIRNGHAITVGANATSNNLTIDNGGSLSISSGTFALNGANIVNGTFTRTSTSTFSNNGTLAFGATGIYNHAMNSGTIPTANWDAASTCNVIGMTNIVPSGLSQTFGNFTWNNPSQSSYINVQNNGFVVSGTLTVGPSSANLFSFANAAGTYTNTVGSLNITGGTFNVTGASATVTLSVLNDVNISGSPTINIQSATTGKGTLNVGRDFNISGTPSLSLQASATNSVGATINITRNFNATSTNTRFIDFGSGTTSSNVINIGGDFTKTGTGTFYTTSSTPALGFVFNGGGVEQNFTYSGANSDYTSYNVSSGSKLKLLSSITLGTGTNPQSIFAVNGELDFQTFSIIAGNTTDPRFNTASTASLKTSNLSGLGGAVVTGSLQGFGSFGSTSAAGRAQLAVGVSYTFNGATTAPFPTVGNFGNPKDININSAVVSNLTSPLTVTGNVNVSSGASFKLNPSASANSLSLGSSSSLNIASNAVFDNAGENQITGLGSVNVLGTFITRDFQGFAGTSAAIPTIVPTLAAGSTVDYEGADQVVTVTPDYSNLRLSGTGSKSVSGSVNVNADLAVMSGAILTLATPTSPAVSSVTVTGAVSNSGTITVNNDANFVQKTGSTYSGSGTFTVLKNAKVPGTQYNYWSSPIFGSTTVGQNMYDIYTNIPATFGVQTYKTSNDRFQNMPNPTRGLPGIGYSIKGPSTNTSSSAVTATFTGTTPNNGDISVALNRVGYNYNLVGNPYPSNLDLNTFYTDNSSVLQNGTFWLWDNTNNTELTQLGTGYTGNSYATWNASGNVGVSGTSTVNSPAKTPTRYASVAQGFIVEANPAASGSLVFKNSERVSNTGVFFASKTQEQTDAYWLQLITPSGVVNTTAVVYNQEALNTLDKFDSGLGILGSDSFYSFADADTSELIIQGRKGDLNITDIVPLGATSFSPGNHSIRLSGRKGIFESGQKIYLYDKLLNQYQDLTAGDYSFNMNKGTFNSRFEIVYKDAAVLGNSDVTKSDFRVYRHHDQYVVESSKMLGKLELYDAGGRLVKVYQTNSTKLEVDMTLLPNGVYVIKAENSGDLKTKKIRK